MHTYLTIKNGNKLYLDPNTITCITPDSLGSLVSIGDNPPFFVLETMEEILTKFFEEEYR